MRLTTLLAAVFLPGAFAKVFDALAPRQTNSEEQYLQKVCNPPTSGGVVPPCQSIEDIQAACAPNGTLPIDYIAHQECMCGGSFFSDYIGCLDCDYVHGARSPSDVAVYHDFMTMASEALCTGTPTAAFNAIFASQNVPVLVTVTNTARSDQFPNETAVSLYFTVSGSQGPGAITGSATLATKTEAKEPAQTSQAGSSLAGSSIGSKTNSGTGTLVAPTIGTSTAASTSTSKAGAVPTGVWMGALGAVAGGMVMIAL